MKATFVSSWDNGSSKIRSACNFNPETKEVTDIEMVDVSEMDLNYLDEESIELPSGEIIKDFTIDGVVIKDGQRDE